MLEGRTGRIVQRSQQKKTMKNRIKNLKAGMMVSFQAGKQQVAEAAHRLDYGEGYEVLTVDPRAEETTPKE
ncbi:MAG: hypothetical protein ACRCZI_05430 [Cetobacterium sp.]